MVIPSVLWNYFIRNIMGVKAIKEKYNIKHIVQLRDGIIWIGSAYISEIIGINMDGKIVKHYKDHRANDDLTRYQKELLVDEANGKLKELVQIKDKFENVKPVFKIEDGKVIELLCEEFGYPNVCTNGELQYENTFFKDYNEAYKELLKGSKSNVSYMWRNLKENTPSNLKQLFKPFKGLLKKIRFYIRVRTIQRFHGFMRKKF